MKDISKLDTYTCSKCKNNPEKMKNEDKSSE